MKCLMALPSGRTPFPDWYSQRRWFVIDATHDGE